MTKLLAEEELSSDRRQAVLAEMAFKSEVLQKGARKRESSTESLYAEIGEQSQYLEQQPDIDSELICAVFKPLLRELEVCISPAGIDK